MSKLSIKILVLGVLVAASGFYFFPIETKAATVAELQATIAQLQTQVNELQAQLNVLTGQTPQPLGGDQKLKVFFTQYYYYFYENAGNAVITVSLSATTTKTVKVSYKTQGGTATPYSDYYPASGTLTFYSGQKIKTFNVSIINDSLVEPNETVGLYLFNPVSLNLGTPSTATLTILNDDNPPVVPSVYFNPSAYSVGEASGSINLTARLSTTTSNTVTVNYSTLNGTAVAWHDYSPATGTLIFNPYEISKNFYINIIDDTLVEGTEYFYATLTNAVNAINNSPQAIINIIDDQELPLVYFDEDPSANENGGSLTLKVNLSTTTSNTVYVNYYTINGTAIAGYDYISTSGTFVINPGNLFATTSIVILDDTLVEGLEYFRAQLTNPINATIGAPSLISAWIVDNDQAPVTPSVYFNPFSYTVDENAYLVTITTRLTTSTNNTVTVNYNTIDGTAIAGSDYYATSGILTFTPGQTSKSFGVRIIDDSLHESMTEQFYATLTNAVNANIDSLKATVTIIDNDPNPTVPGVYFYPSSYSIMENATGLAAIGVRLSTSTSNTVTVGYSTFNGTAIAGSDYYPASGTLMFNPYQTSNYFYIDVIDDSIYEGNETVNLSLFNPVNAVLQNPYNAVLTIIDNEYSTNTPKFIQIEDFKSQLASIQETLLKLLSEVNILINK